MPVVMAAPAKINIFLKILSLRPDGYHELFSWMHKLAIADKMTVESVGSGIDLRCPDSELPEDRDNLIYRAAMAFFAATGIKGGARITLEKKIPVAAGLGGGSSDAASCLVGLDRVFATDLGLEKLERIGLALGADVPFFVREGVSFWCEGVGEKLSAAPFLGDFRILLVNPGFAVKTAWVYHNLPLTSMGNTYNLAPGKKDELTRRWLERNSFASLPFPLENDLEAVTMSSHPLVAGIRDEMRRQGAVTAMMSGSGPTVFGLFADHALADTAAAFFAPRYGEGVVLTSPAAAVK